MAPRTRARARGDDVAPDDGRARDGTTTSGRAMRTTITNGRSSSTSTRARAAEMAAANEPEDAQSDRGTNSDNSTNEYTYGTSDGSDEGRRLLVGSEGREPMRFINPVRLMRYLERKK
ncbi:hypothetical protein OT_ostta06g00135 [Ostreococcus tauri]|uniref:Uncharacterized protein n=1 Tax=Ostreococcus tauri TaxID=70448 RepID=A0A090M1X8_OSTTA|nr:hypothetical protein OT_ostta06g00135 [Ostreococcus tauri]CEF98196.1 hypothetical protein OT_ostta06g00135 [Ostreococcus tauri]|eukprot:XP_022839131.1 hypothetical protein OT_ostta06g00135 [Ostreococcus tauri]